MPPAQSLLSTVSSFVTVNIIFSFVISRFTASYPGFYWDELEVAGNKTYDLPF